MAKIRNGFVSNSSSSSFLIYGTTVSTSEINEAYKKKMNSEPNEDDEDDYDNDSIYDLLKDSELNYHCPYDDDYYVGISYSSIKDDETGAQFKQRVEKLIKELFGEDTNVIHMKPLGMIKNIIRS